jgi:hypothetical protein
MIFPDRALDDQTPHGTMRACDLFAAGAIQTCQCPSCLTASKLIAPRRMASVAAATTIGPVYRRREEEWVGHRYPGAAVPAEVLVFMDVEV